MGQVLRNPTGERVFCCVGVAVVVVVVIVVLFFFFFLFFFLFCRLFIINMKMLMVLCSTLPPHPLHRAASLPDHLFHKMRNFQQAPPHPNPIAEVPPPPHPTPNTLPHMTTMQRAKSGLRRQFSRIPHALTRHPATPRGGPAPSPPTQPAPHQRHVAAYVGGLDLAAGRYDTSEHLVFPSGGAKEGPFAGDFQNPSCSGFDEAKGGPREPWHDVHCRYVVVRGMWW